MTNRSGSGSGTRLGPEVPWKMPDTSDGSRSTSSKRTRPPTSLPAASLTSALDTAGSRDSAPKSGAAASKSRPPPVITEPGGGSGGGRSPASASPIRIRSST